MLPKTVSSSSWTHSRVRFPSLSCCWMCWSEWVLNNGRCIQKDLLVRTAPMECFIFFLMQRKSWKFCKAMNEIVSRRHLCPWTTTWRLRICCCCFNAILPNHPTLSLSHRVQKTVLYICVSFAVSHTGSLLIQIYVTNRTLSLCGEGSPSACFGLSCIEVRCSHKLGMHTLLCSEPANGSRLSNYKV